MTPGPCRRPGGTGCTLAAIAFAAVLMAAGTPQAREGPAPHPPPPKPKPGLTVSSTHSAPPALLPGQTLIIAAVGDIIPHDTIQQNVVVHPDRFGHLWWPLLPILTGADITYGNLETPLALGVLGSGLIVAGDRQTYDGHVFTGYPTFNAPPALATALKAAGFAVVSTANNHAMDRHSIGVDRTIAVLRNAGIGLTGTRPAAAGPGWRWETVVERKGMRVAWLACTYGSNVSPDDHPQVLNCFTDRSVVMRTLRDLAARPTVDVVVFTPHFGDEYIGAPNAAQRSLAREAAEAGANIVIGNHPHVPQPWELYTTADGRGVPIAYSLGNFVSNQKPLKTRASVVLLFAVSRDTSGRARVHGAGYLPILTHRHETAEAPHVPGEPPAWITATFAQPGLAEGAQVHALLRERLGGAALLTPEEAMAATRGRHHLPALSAVPPADPQNRTAVLARATEPTWAPYEGPLVADDRPLAPEGATGLTVDAPFTAPPEGPTLLIVRRDGQLTRHQDDQAPASAGSASTRFGP